MYFLIMREITEITELRRTRQQLLTVPARRRERVGMGAAARGWRVAAKLRATRVKQRVGAAPGSSGGGARNRHGAGAAPEANWG